MPDPVEINTPGGWISIDVYDPGTFDFEPVEIYTPNGWKVPYFGDPSEADTAVELYTQSGWKGLFTTGILRIDDFEDGNRSGWTVPGSTGSDNVYSPGLNGTNHRWQLNGFREAHLAGADAVDRGPEPGDIFEFWFRIEAAGGSVINRFEFSADGINEPDCYRLEFERGTGDNEFSLEKIQNGGQAKVDTDPGHSVNINQIYRCEVHWNVGNNSITAQLFFPNGNAASDQLSISDASSGEFAQPGISLRANSNNNWSIDEIRILPSG